MRELKCGDGRKPVLLPNWQCAVYERSARDAEAEKETLHSPLLPENLYVADATILPEAMGNPPILTIMALSKRISRIISNSGK